MRWSIITGEYPPQPGGVSDYTASVASGLARCGDEVHVWAPGTAGSQHGRFVHEHRLKGKFGLRGLSDVSRGLDEVRSDRLLIQYVPHAFGFKGLNLPFCVWLSTRPESVYVMFHEVAFPVRRGQPLRHNALGGINRLKAFIVARRADRIFVAIPGWAQILRRLTKTVESITWLPVPSSIPAYSNPNESRLIRDKYA